MIYCIFLPIQNNPQKKWPTTPFAAAGTLSYVPRGSLKVKVTAELCNCE